MTLVDTNAHVLAPEAERASYPLSAELANPGDLAHDHTSDVEGYVRLMDAAGVDQAYLVSSRFHGFDNGYCASAGARFPGRFATIANVNIRAADAVDQVSHWIEGRGMHGVRLWGGGRGVATWIDDAALFPVWERVANLGVPVNAQRTTGAILPATRHLLNKLPELKLTISNAAGIDVTAGPDSPAVRDLLSLAAFPNVHVNFSTDLVRSALVADSPARRFLLALLEQFGAQRLLWSAFYTHGRGESYAAVVDVIRHGLGYLTADEREWVQWRSAQALYPALRRNFPAH